MSDTLGTRRFSHEKKKEQKVPTIKTALINETLLAGGYGVKIIFKLTLSNRIKPG